MDQKIKEYIKTSIRYDGSYSAKIIMFCAAVKSAKGELNNRSIRDYIMGLGNLSGFPFTDYQISLDAKVLGLPDGYDRFYREITSIILSEHNVIRANRKKYSESGHTTSYGLICGCKQNYMVKLDKRNKIMLLTLSYDAVNKECVIEVFNGGTLPALKEIRIDAEKDKCFKQAWNTYKKYKRLLKFMERRNKR